jgi:hypothetical protein
VLSVTPSGQRADDWICTSIIRFTRPAPFSVEPRRQIKKGDRAESNRRQTDSQSVSGNQHRTRPQRKERELNPQGTFVLDRLPTGSRRQSGCPSVLFFSISSPTRNRTRNFSLEARHDVRFTIEP